MHFVSSDLYVSMENSLLLTVELVVAQGVSKSTFTVQKILSYIRYSLLSSTDTLKAAIFLLKISIQVFTSSVVVFLNCGGNVHFCFQQL